MNPHLSLLKPPASTNLLFVPLITYSGYFTSGITPKVTFCVWLLLPSIIFLNKQLFSFLSFIFYLFIFMLFEWQKANRDLLNSGSLSSNSWGCARQKPGAHGPTQVSPVYGRDPSTWVTTCTSAGSRTGSKAGLKLRPLDRGCRHPNHSANDLPSMVLGNPCCDMYQY